MTWLLTSIDAETSNGFKRTREIAGHPAYVEFDSANGYGQGSIEVFVARRFLVKVHGQRVGPNLIERAIHAIDLDALARMREDGRDGQGPPRN